LSWGGRTGEHRIRFKCSNRIINESQIPEEGYLTVHIKGYNKDVGYEVKGSSLRVNLGAGFTDLFTEKVAVV
jgi:hypothetical protein